MTTDSLVFYRSFYEAVEEIETPEARARVYKAIFEYGLNGKAPELKGAEKAIFKLIKPQIDANLRKRENGGKGGRPKNQNQTKPKPNHNQDTTNPKPNVNANVNANVNVNDNGENDALAPEKAPHGLFGFFHNVRLSAEEAEELKKAMPDSYEDYIERLSAHKESSGRIYHSDYATIRKWEREDRQKEKGQPKKAAGPIDTYDFIPITEMED